MGGWRGFTMVLDGRGGGSVRRCTVNHPRCAEPALTVTSKGPTGCHFARFSLAGGKPACFSLAACNM